MNPGLVRLSILTVVPVTFGMAALGYALDWKSGVIGGATLITMTVTAFVVSNVYFHRRRLAGARESRQPPHARS